MLIEYGKIGLYVSSKEFSYILYDYNIEEYFDRSEIHITGKLVVTKYTEEIITDSETLDKILPSYIVYRRKGLFNKEKIKCVVPHWYKIKTDEHISIRSTEKYTIIE